MPDIRPEDVPAPRRRLSRALLLGLKFLIGAGIVVWILHDLDYAATFAILRSFPPYLFALAMLLQVFTQSLQAARWKVLTGRADIPYRDFLGFVSLGYVMAIVSPSVLVSDSANAWLMGKRNHSVVLSISAMMAGRVLGLVGMFLLFLIALPGHLWFFRLPLLKLDSGTALAAAGAAAAAVIAVLLVVRRRPVWLETIRTRAGRLWAEARQVLSNRRAVAIGLLLSVGLQLVQMTVMWLGFYAMRIPVSLTDVLFFVPLVTLIALIPGLGQAGVREGIVFVFFSTLPGVAREQIVASFGYGYALFVVMGLLNLGFAGWALRLDRSGGKLYRWILPSRGNRKAT